MKSIYENKIYRFGALGVVFGLSIWLISSAWDDSDIGLSRSDLNNSKSALVDGRQQDALRKNSALNAKNQNMQLDEDLDFESDSEVMALAKRQKEKADRDQAAYEQSVRGAESTKDAITNTVVASEHKKAAANDRLQDQSQNQDLFSNEDLKFLEKSGAAVSTGSSLIPGKRSKSKSGSNSPSVNNITAAPSATPTPDAKQPRFTGQARGYEIFYLMQPEARLASEKQVQNLIDSGLKEVYLGVLTDGTFGKDYSYLRQTLDRLHEAQRDITLLAYIVNGSAMRRYKNTKVITAFSQIEPEKFRKLIVSDAAVKETFRNLVSELKPVFEYNLKLNPNNTNIAVVMLEDNLTVESYAAMRKIAAAELGNLAELMRNPCPNCYDGNDTNSLGDQLISHELENLSGLGPGDGFSLDGIGFTHNATSRGKELVLSDVSKYQQKAQQKNLRFFALWDAERQGLYAGEYPKASERIYEVPTTEELEAEQLLLQEGLDPTTIQ